MSYNSNYTGTQVENRLKQGYYEDIIAQGVAAGFYTEDEVPTKEELDAKLANPELGGGGNSGKRKLVDISSFLLLGVSDVEGENEYITFKAIKKHFENYTEDAQSFGQSILDLYKNGDDFSSNASVSNGIERTTQFYSYISNYNNGPRFLYIDFDIYFIETISGSGESYSTIKIYFPTSTTLCLKISFTNADYKGRFKSIGTFKSAEIESIMPGKRHLFSSDYFPTNVATIDELKEYIDSLGVDYKYYLASKIKGLFTDYNVTELYSIQKNKNGFEEINNTLFIDVSFDYKYDDAGTIHSWEYITLSIYDPKQSGRILKVKTVFDYYDEGTGSETRGSTTTEIIEYSTYIPVPGKRYKIEDILDSLYLDNSINSERVDLQDIADYYNGSTDNVLSILNTISKLYAEKGVTQFYTTEGSGTGSEDYERNVFFIDFSMYIYNCASNLCEQKFCIDIYRPTSNIKVHITGYGSSSEKSENTIYYFTSVSNPEAKIISNGGVDGSRYMLDLSELVSLNNGSTINNIEKLYNLLLANTAEAETLILSAINAFKKEGVYSFVADGLGEEMSTEQHYTFYADLNFDESWASGSQTMEITSLYFYNPYNRNEKIKLYYTDGYMDSGTVHVEYVKKPTSRKYISSGISGAGDTLSDIKTYFENNTSSAKSFKDEIIKQFENFGETEFYYSDSMDFNSASNLSYKLFYIDLSVYAYNDTSDYVYDIINITIYDNKNPNEKLVLKFRGFVTSGSITHTDATFNSAAIIELSKIGQEKYDTVTLTADHQGTGILPPSVSKGYRAVYEYYNPTDSEITFYVSREDGTVSDISVTVAPSESVFLQFIKGYGDKLYVNRLYLDSLSQ